MLKTITIGREFGSGGRTIGIEKSVALIVDAVGGVADYE